MESTGTEPRGDRGQLIIVISLVLATLFVALALILNSGIYAENLSTRETTDSSDVSLTIQQVDRETREAMRAANRIEESQEPSDAIDNFTASFDAVSVAVANERALRGQALDMSQSEPSDGFTLQQDNATRNYTDASGTPDWKLANDVERMAGVRFNVERDHLLNTDELDDIEEDAFNVEFDDGGEEWFVFMHREDDTVVITAANGSELNVLGLIDEIDDLTGYDDEDCKVDAESVEVDFAAGTVDGKPCTALAYDEDLSENLTISFNNGDKGGGTYLILVDTAVEDIEGDFNDPTQSPFKNGAVFDATVEVTFERSDVRYSTSRNVTAEPLAYEAD